MEAARLRRELRRRRQAMPAADRIDAALAIAAHLTAALLNPRFRRIGAYVAVRGEADPGPFIAAARARGAELYLPALDRRRSRLRFIRTPAGAPLVPNRFGIPEPASGSVVAAAFLNLVLVPLVGFDGAGNRLGMGAGYYDRAFGFRLHRTHWHAPRLVGVAYDFQRVDALDARPWDVPLDGIVTESGFRWL